MLNIKSAVRNFRIVGKMKFFFSWLKNPRRKLMRNFEEIRNLQNDKWIHLSRRKMNFRPTALKKTENVVQSVGGGW